MKIKYYVDSCIYLNLWQKEKPFWIYARDFFEKHENDLIIYSGFILKELNHILGDSDFSKRKRVFSRENFLRLSVSDRDYSLARVLEVRFDYKISFFDIMHIILADKSRAILVTRDRLLIRFSKSYGIKSQRPEDII